MLHVDQTIILSVRSYKSMKIIHSINENYEFDLASNIAYPYKCVVFCTFSKEIISARGMIHEYH